MVPSAPGTVISGSQWRNARCVLVGAPVTARTAEMCDFDEYFRCRQRGSSALSQRSESIARCDVRYALASLFRELGGP
jgi:hypothetical protein